MSVKVKSVKQKKELNSISVIMMSVFLSFAVFVFMLIIFSFYIMKTHTQISVLQLFVIIASGISTLFSGFLSSYAIKSKKLIFGMLSGIFVAVCEFLILLCFNNASLTWQVYFLIPVAIITSFVGCLTGINIKK